MKNKLPVIFFTPVELAKIQQADRSKLPQQLSLSVDAGRTLGDAILIDGQTLEVSGSKISIAELINARIDDRSIWKYESGNWEKWQRFDSQTEKFYKMVFVAPGKPPTVEISGVKMHVTQNGDPQIDTTNKLKSLGNIQGRMLDTCMGLGYTAIAAAKRNQVTEVVVCEADVNMFALCNENPWSAELFDNPKIHPVIVPVQEVVKRMPDASIDFVVHDPPRFALAPELYSENFYRQLFRILKPGGKIYHYTGNPNQRVRRRSLPEQTATLLNKTGFRDVREAYFGVVGKK